MDISSYISELLFQHDCVIIPNFGGFICNYKPADIHPVLNTIAPPSKAISFNRNLQSNDGLLVNYISKALGISFDSAYDSVSSWVKSSKNLLKKGEELRLRKVGKFTNDIEGNLQFVPTVEVNYLKPSFGLRTLTIEPIVRSKQIDFTEKFKYETKQPATRRRVWSIAASVLLVISLVALVELMWIGVAINPLQDEAGMFSCLKTMFKAPVPEATSIPAPVKNTPVLIAPVAVDSIAQVTEEPVKEEAPVVTVSSPTYYIVVGAFAEEKNIEAAKRRLQEKYPDSIILVDKAGRLTKLGYMVGNSFYQAKEQLTTAQAENSSYWLLKK